MPCAMLTLHSFVYADKASFNYNQNSVESHVDEEHATFFQFYPKHAAALYYANAESWF